MSVKYVIEDMSVKEDMKIVYNYECKVCNRRRECKRRHEHCLQCYTCDECELTAFAPFLLWIAFPF